MGAVTAVTDADFADVVLQSAKPVVVDYWADWCAPCKQLSPIIEELAGELGDKVTFVKMDTNTNTDTPIQQGIMSLPTIQVFVGGEVVKQFIGAKPKATFVKALDEYL
jgi:thioredoxin 1